MKKALWIFFPDLLIGFAYLLILCVLHRIFSVSIPIWFFLVTFGIAQPAIVRLLMRKRRGA